MQLVGLIRFAQFVFPVIAICYYLFVLPQPITDPFPVNDRFVSRKDARVLLYEKYYPVENAKATVVWAWILFFIFLLDYFTWMGRTCW